MGLDITHGTWTGAYGAFNRWRGKLAAAAGYDVEAWMLLNPTAWKLHQMGAAQAAQFQPPPETSERNIAWGRVTDENVQGRWDRLPEDPLVVLLVHSDCDGEIVADHLLPLAARLEQLIPLLPDEPAAGHIGHWRDKTQEFIDGLRTAHDAGEPVVFW